MGKSETHQILTRWMAHRIAELIERQDTVPDEVAREAARRECADLILRLWSRREDWPARAPLSNIKSLFQKRVDAYTHSRTGEVGPADSWWDALDALDSIHGEESSVIFTGAVLDLDVQEVEEDIRSAEAFGENLSEEEAEDVAFLKRLLVLRSGLKTLAEGSEAERLHYLSDRLNDLNTKRGRLLRTLLSPGTDKPEVEGPSLHSRNGGGDGGRV